MATKGTSRRERGTAPGARRRGRRRLRRAAAAVAVVLLVAGVLGGLRVWQNASRSAALREYDEALTVAQRPLLQHLLPGSLSGMFELPGAFERGELDARRFREAARAWERDFTAARDAVGALEPPPPLVGANRLIWRGIDMYVGVARLYVPAAEQRALADGESEPVRRRRLEAQVEALLRQANEWRARADEVYDLGREQIDRLREEWLGEPGLPKPEELPGNPGESPGGTR